MNPPAEEAARPPSAPAPSPDAAPLPRGLRLRVTVLIPLAVTFLVMVSGFLALWVSYPLFFPTGRPVSLSVLELRMVAALAAVVSFSLFSLLVATVLARSVARPLREFTARVRALSPGPAEDAAAPRDVTEIGALSTALEDMVSSVPGLMFDRYTLRSLESGVVTLARDGTITSLNPVAEGILRCRAEEQVGRPMAEALAPDPANEAFLRSVRAALVGPASFSSAEAVVSVRGGHRVQLGYSICPLRDAAGSPLGVVLTFKDMAGRKAAEARIRRTETLALLGAMATHVAHEIRNPLGAMNGLVELLRRAVPEGAPARAHAGEILQSIARINRICQTLLTVGDPEPHSLQPLDINELAQTTLEFARYDATHEDAAVHTAFAPDLPPIPGDVERLRQVFLNLLRNAFQACGPNGEVTLSTRRTPDGVAVDIHNTGEPIPPDEMPKLFTLFHTTRPRGTGIGLAISQHLVRAHGGRIRVHSTPEDGTTFTVELPSPVSSPQPAGE